MDLILMDFLRDFVQAGFRGDNVDVTSGNECIFLLLISYVLSMT